MSITLVLTLTKVSPNVAGVLPFIVLIDHEKLVFGFNAVEGAFWILGGIVVFLRNLRQSSGRVRKIGAFAAGVFALFGVSDFIECFTGAWWDPWWLFDLKVSSVLAQVACFYAYRKEKASHKVPTSL